jgi:hypothetical protein
MKKLVLWFNPISTTGLIILFTVSASVLPKPQAIGDIRVNEFLADPPTGLSGDANRDGVRDAYDDEFIELVNISASILDISGWTVSDDTQVRHIFPQSTYLHDGCGIVVFGGGSPTGNFGGSIVQVSSSGRLGLTNTGNTFYLKDGETVMETITYSNEAAQNQSLNRQPELTGSFVLHSTIAPGGSIFSPGTKVDGSPFRSGCPGNLKYLYLPLVFR